MAAAEILENVEKIDIGGHTLEVLHEPGDAPYIVFIHGGPGSLWNPIEQIRGFRDERGVVSYSLTGFGNSDSRENDSLEKHVEDLRKLLETLGIEEFILHGHSYGTEVALDYASKYDVEGVIISGGHAYITPPIWEKVMFKSILGLRIYDLPVMNYLLRDTSRFLLHDGIDAEIKEEIIATTPASHRRSAWQTIVDCFWDYEHPELENIDVPFLFIHGAEDKMASMDKVEKTVEKLPNAELTVFEKCGHVPMIENPERYNEVIREFIQNRV